MVSGKAWNRRGAVIGGASLAGIFLRLVAQLRDARMAEQRVVVEGHLGVERHHAVLGDHQPFG